MTLPDPLTVACSWCLAAVGEPCGGVTMDIGGQAHPSRVGAAARAAESAGLTHDGYVDTRTPPPGRSGISPSPTLDPIRAHALLCAAHFLAGKPTRSLPVGAGDCVAVARVLETYLRESWAPPS